MSSETLDTGSLSHKEMIRKNIREAMSNKSYSNYAGVDLSSPVLDKIQNPVVEFINNFRAAGGKFLPCGKNDFIKMMIHLVKSQHYDTLLNTNPKLGEYLNKYNVPHVNAINPNYPADAMLVFSDVLVARSGSVGFTQGVARYASVKNLAKDIIVVTRDVCVFEDMEDAIENLKKRHKNVQPPMVEFLTPTKPVNPAGTDDYQPTKPRFLMLMLAENVEKPAQPMPNKENATDDESQTQESDC